MTLDELKDYMRTGGYTLVVYDGAVPHPFKGRGVADLYRLLSDSPETLSCAVVVDKVIGKGAAALMILGGVAEVYSDVVSSAALNLFKNSSVRVSYGNEVPYIVNRAGDGVCPVETLCRDCVTPEECLPLIENFIVSR